MNNIISQEEKDNIDSICKQYKITNYTINNDGSIDVVGDVNLEHSVTSGKLPLKFNKVTGNFICRNTNLTTLIGCPVELGGSFLCYHNKLTSLMGCPDVVRGYFNCSNNELTSLIGSPKKVEGGFICSENPMTSLEHCPNDVSGGISFLNNDLPKIFQDTYVNLPYKTKWLFTKYMNYYDVWSPEFNEDNMQLLIDDIKDGLQ